MGAISGRFMGGSSFTCQTARNTRELGRRTSGVLKKAPPRAGTNRVSERAPWLADLAGAIKVRALATNPAAHIFAT